MGQLVVQHGLAEWLSACVACHRLFFLMVIADAIGPGGAARLACDCTDTS